MRAFSQVDKVRESIQTATFLTAPPNTTIAEYSCCNHAKFELVSHAIEQGWVETRNCCWLDCGKALESLSLKNDHLYQISNLVDTMDRIHYNQAKPYETKTLAEIQTGQRGAGEYWVAGGFFIGKKNAMQRWCEKYLLHALRYQTEGWIFTEQATIYAMFAEGLADEIVAENYPDAWCGLHKHLLQPCAIQPRNSDIH
jgi:hypothetical protein